MYKLISNDKPISTQESFKVIDEIIKGKNLTKVLLIPPDVTRIHSQTGPITNYAYTKLTNMGVSVQIIPALGSHKPMSETEYKEMFKDAPYDEMIIHDWRNDTVNIGTVPSEVVKKASDGRIDYEIPVEVNKVLYDDYDLIISLGQVVPHEVVGLANYSKNIFVGLGGSNMIDGTHFMSAVCGIESTLGEMNSAVRYVFDYSQKQFLADLPIIFVLTVVGDSGLTGVFASPDRDCFEAACELACEVNIKYIDAVDTAICYMSPHEYKATWLSNKAVYRTRCVIKDGGTLYILAPGVKEFGEDEQIDKLIRKYGYVDFATVLEKSKKNKDLAASLSAAAHLIHGSCDKRFRIVYCVENISKQEIESVNYDYMPYKNAKEMVDELNLKQGVNVIDGKRILYTEHAALELWKESFS